jgi:hypothetical protein
MTAREIGHHLRTHWIKGALAAGWVYRGGGSWGTLDRGPYDRAGRRADRKVPRAGFRRELRALAGLE